jgi:hypothetical protein
VLPYVAALLVTLAACGDDENDEFFTGPDRPPAEGGNGGNGGNGGGNADVKCEGDDRAPVLTRLRPSKSELWPPDHRMVRVNIHGRAEDDCGPIEWKIVDVKSNQPVDGEGDGDTSPDWRIIGPMSVDLRAERSGKRGRREYKIRVRFADANGNADFESVSVWVPRDQGR